MKSRNPTESNKMFNTCSSEEFKAARFNAKLLQMGDEVVSKDLSNAVEGQNLRYKMAFTGDNGTDPAEPAFRDFKTNFIAVGSCADTSYPSNAW